MIYTVPVQSTQRFVCMPRRLVAETTLAEFSFLAPLHWSQLGPIYVALSPMILNWCLLSVVLQHLCLVIPWKSDETGIKRGPTGKGCNVTGTFPSQKCGARPPWQGVDTMYSVLPPSHSWSCPAHTYHHIFWHRGFLNEESIIIVHLYFNIFVWYTPNCWCTTVSYL